MTSINVNTSLRIGVSKCLSDVEINANILYCRHLLGGCCCSHQHFKYRLGALYILSVRMYVLMYSR